MVSRCPREGGGRRARVLRPDPAVIGPPPRGWTSDAKGPHPCRRQSGSERHTCLRGPAAPSRRRTSWASSCGSTVTTTWWLTCRSSPATWSPTCWLTRAVRSSSCWRNAPSAWSSPCTPWPPCPAVMQTQGAGEGDDRAVPTSVGSTVEWGADTDAQGGRSVWVMFALQAAHLQRVGRRWVAGGGARRPDASVGSRVGVSSLRGHAQSACAPRGMGQGSGGASRLAVSLSAQATMSDQAEAGGVRAVDADHGADHRLLEQERR